MKHRIWFISTLILAFLFGTGILLGRIQAITSGVAQAEVSFLSTTPLPIGLNPAPTEVVLPRQDSPTTPPLPVQPQSTTNPLPAPPDVQQLQDGLASVNWEFIPANLSESNKAVISSDQASDIVKQRYAASDSKITTHFGWLQNHSLSQAKSDGATTKGVFASQQLVWIVTLSGLQQTSSGPPDQQRKQSNELNVVIDAVSGEYLMDFVWNR